MKGKKTGDEIIGDCKTVRCSSEFGLLHFVCGQSVKDFTYLFAEMLHPRRLITGFSTTLRRGKKGKGKVSNNLDNEIAPFNPAWFCLAVA